MLLKYPCSRRPVQTVGLEFPGFPLSLSKVIIVQSTLLEATTLEPGS